MNLFSTTSLQGHLEVSYLLGNVFPKALDQDSKGSPLKTNRPLYIKRLDPKRPPGDIGLTKEILLRPTDQAQYSVQSNL